MSRNGRHTGHTGGHWLFATLGALLLGAICLAVGAWALSRPHTRPTPWGLGGGVIAGPILLGIAIAELTRRWWRNRGHTGRHTNPR